MNDDKKNKQNREEEPWFQDFFDYEKISGHLFTRALWAVFLRLAFKVYIRLKIKGRLKKFYKKYPKLIIISNHTSHLDGPAILSAVPFSQWMDLYILAAEDYWFTNGFLRFFSKYFMNAIPVKRLRRRPLKTSAPEPAGPPPDARRTASFKNCLDLLNSLKRVWMIMFPEGTRSVDGSLKPFNKGAAVLSQKTNTPILFLYFYGNHALWPREKSFPRPGRSRMYVGPVQPPADIDTIFNNYKQWAQKLNIYGKQKPLGAKVEGLKKQKPAPAKIIKNKPH